MRIKEREREALREKPLRENQTIYRKKDKCVLWAGKIRKER